MARLILSDEDFNNASRIINLPDPTSAQHAATKAYVDGVVEGLAWKDSARVATTANVNLSSPGATIDGISLATSDRVLVKNQTSQPENGIYIWNGAATPMTRAPDMNVAAEFEAAVVQVEEGSTNAGTTWRQTAVNITVGSTNVAWTTFGTAAGAASETTAGIAEIATQAETDTGTDDARIVTPLKLATWSGRARIKTGTIGDGSATQIDVTHNWATNNVQVELYRNSGNFDTVQCDVSRPTTNTVRFNFAVAPSASQFAYILMAGGTP